MLFVMTRSWLSSAPSPVSTSLHITGGRGNQPRQAVLSDDQMERDVDQAHSNQQSLRFIYCDVMLCIDVVLLLLTVTVKNSRTLKCEE